MAARTLSASVSFARQVPTALNSFLESYNSQRYRGPDSTDIGRRRRAGPSTSIFSPFTEPLSAGPPGSPKSRSLFASPRHAYTLIRSDVEDEIDTGLPSISSSGPGMKQPSADLRFKSRLGLADSAEFGEQVTAPYMAWVESTWFQSLSGLAILTNAFVIGLETDIDTVWWWWLEQILLGYFVFELLVRLCREGLRFFHKEEEWQWNLFDFSIVMSGVFDTWLIPLLFANLQEQMGSHISLLFMLMRMGRLLRIVRLFRLVRIVTPLFELAMGILEALQGMFWVLVFMIMTLYATAVICTKIIGHGNIIDTTSNAELQNIKDMFSTVDKSMFTLFGTVSSWSLLKFVPLFDEMPLLRPALVLFYVYSAWALLAVMTGVVSENMIAIRDQMLKEDRERQDARRHNITEHLLELFRKADVDDSGMLSREEFDALMIRPEVVKKIHRNTHMRASDLYELFDLIDHDGSGQITIDEFMAGFKWVNEPLRSKSLVKLQQRLDKDLLQLEDKITMSVETKAEEVRQTISQPLRKVHAITEQLQNLAAQLNELRSVVKDHGANIPTEKEMRDAEQRLTQRLDGMLERMANLEAFATTQRVMR